MLLPDNCRLLLSILLAYVIHLADGCGRTPARTKPPVTTAHPNERTTPGPGGPSTLKPNSHKLVCTEEEIKEAACLHGGQCFAIKLLDARSALCQCSEQYTGTRCEQLDDSFFGEFLSADKVTKASIAAGVLALVIILVVIIVYLVIKKRKQRKARAEANGQANGHAGKALIADKDKGTTIDEDEKCTDV